jgi:hypothetical protein
MPGYRGPIARNQSTIKGQGEYDIFGKVATVVWVGGSVRSAYDGSDKDNGCVDHLYRQAEPKQDISETQQT